MSKKYYKCINNAIEWAKCHLNSTEYMFRCLGFLEDAIEQSNDIVILRVDSAKESANLYESYQHTGIPPKGAFVFYDCYGQVNGEYRNWGHVGLSINNGDVIHSWDRVRIDNYLEVENLASAPGVEKPKYIGWVPLEHIIVGIQKNMYKRMD
ncbi:hypothetical protein [Candidatus Clostridium stratigraminis]|uniref:NlpC/P60 domain-containing protein n=1 Tax=Candidatus Clostridium stratigraminis TaxID=3381661 RepID=A0ABW8T901_9CLOT